MFSFSSGREFGRSAAVEALEVPSRALRMPECKIGLPGVKWRRGAGRMKGS